MLKARLLCSCTLIVLLVAVVVSAESAEQVTSPKLLKKVDPVYTEAAREAKVEGSVTLEIIVTADGKTRVQRVVQSKFLINNQPVDPSIQFGLDERAIEAVRQWEFAPGTRDGQPVAVQFRVEVTFTLQ